MAVLNPSGVIGSKVEYLRSISATRNISEMKAKAQNEVIVLGELISSGNYVAINSLPGSGKTLITIFNIIESIQRGTIEGKNVFYFNYDDNYQGFIDKAEIAAHFGFNMIGPNQLSAEKAITLIVELAGTEEAHGMIIVLDTIKKFSSIMNKTASSEFNDKLRKFSMAGGTPIALGHVNKKRDEDNNVIEAGTQDTMDDVDVLYLLDADKGEGRTVVWFDSRKKNRTTSAELAYYSFGSVKHLPTQDDHGNHINNYWALIQTVRRISSAEATLEKDTIERVASLKKNYEVIGYICQEIFAGNNQQTNIRNAINAKHGIGKNKITEILKIHTYTTLYAYSKEAGFCWQVTGGLNNSLVYQVLTN